ncbi:hydrogenase maturation protease [Knoellia sp. 3-2P3]|uniref:hydrogenase maturation protease n=1 Tax=unclassified Knoellia TaxID=2618719 RepID=UPI0023DA6742|nr:hydrogenase maturation protease [Knoellia sp. 3-2P3]MDF2092175.1 hydrogenase maturation protease [Knoellia sp. 3-2P3]
MRGAPTGPVTSRPLVVGLGSPDRGDDAVGVVVARAVAARHLPGVDVVAHEDPTDLVELWSGRELALVVDAVRSGAEPGAVVVLETGASGERLPESAWGRTGRGGTHAFGLAAAVELARALRRLPDRVVLVGVEAASFDHRATLSPTVAAAVPTAVERVLATVGEAPAGTAAPEGAARVPG